MHFLKLRTVFQSILMIYFNWNRLFNLSIVFLLFQLSSFEQNEYD